MEWQMYWALEPPLADRLELAIGILASLVANVNRDSKERSEPFMPREFMVDWAAHLNDRSDEEEDGMAPARVMATMEQMMMAQERRMKSVSPA